MDFQHTYAACKKLCKINSVTELIKSRQEDIVFTKGKIEERGVKDNWSAKFVCKNCGFENFVLSLSPESDFFKSILKTL